MSRDGRRPVPRAAGRRRARKAEAALMWGMIALGGVVTLAVFVVWHLSRRARLIRERLGPPRLVDLSEFAPIDAAHQEPGSR